MLNEALGLAWVLDRIPYARLKRNGYRTTVLVMDGHSTDTTAEVAEEYGVLFIDQDDSGKGSAIRHGFREAVKLDADAVVMLDADGTYAPVEMTRLLEGLDRHEVVIGDRLNGRIEPDAMTRLNFVGTFSRVCNGPVRHHNGGCLLGVLGVQQRRHQPCS